jgi:hypothetical protein
MKRSSPLIAILSLIVASAHAAPPSNGNSPVSCDELRFPPAAAKTVPTPFDRYMRFSCHRATGQGLGPVDGFRWINPKGLGMALSATSAAGGPDAKGKMHFPYSWYTRLEAVDMPAEDQNALKSDLKRYVRANLLEGASVLELRATTSNAEEKRIVLLVWDGGREPLKGPLVLECNGVCFRDDAEPLILMGQPG